MEHLPLNTLIDLAQSDVDESTRIWACCKSSAMKPSAQVDALTQYRDDTGDAWPPRRKGA